MCSVKSYECSNEMLSFGINTGPQSFCLSFIIMLLFKDSLEIRRSSMLSRYFCYGRSFCTLLYQKQLVIVVKLGPDFWDTV